MTFAKFADLLSLQGQLLEGVSFDDSATLQALGQRVMKPHCAVYSWIVLDVISASDIDNPGSAFTQGGVLDNSSEATSRPPELPLVLVAHYVEFHSESRFNKGDSICTDYAVAYDNRGIFETADTIYVLFGKGFRRPAPIEAIRSIPEGLIDTAGWIDAPEEHSHGIQALNSDSDTVHCDLQMTSAQGEELLAFARQLREAGGHRALDTVLQDMEDELDRSLAQTRKGTPNQ
ncbi:hypothetical protein RA263_27175 [Pseudomonas syringae pv. tagetis]|uniref:DUF6957 domain-containing protein n=1 Tax=Pseudomonas syringae pv. tagetis TaxID=129140 RepID=A0ABW7NVD4_9PSED|nr:hypothetical protein [Pseudomonas syringae group genomosp. 7]